MEMNPETWKQTPVKMPVLQAGGVYQFEGYMPSEEEPYMNPEQLEYFRGKLMRWRDHLVGASQESLRGLAVQRDREKDLLDEGALESDIQIKLEARDRCRKLIHQIADALERINNGTYGYCEETGEEIGIRRLEVLPIATLSLEAQKNLERKTLRRG